MLTTQIPNLEFGIYRDDGLCVSNATPRLTEKLRKKIVKLFQENGLGTTSSANLTQVQFLDVTLDLKTRFTNPTSNLGTSQLMFIVNPTTLHPSFGTYSHQ